MDEVTERGGGSAALNEDVGTAELSSLWVWSSGDGRRDSGVVSAVDVVIGRQGGVTTVERASATLLRNMSRSRMLLPTRLRLLR